MEQNGRIEKPMIELNHIRKRFESAGRVKEVVNDVSLEVKENEFVVLFGPGQCGKTTMINLIAGLETVSEGTVTVDGKTVEEPGPDRGVVYQTTALFPFCTVMGNVEFGPKSRKIDKKARRERAQYFINLMGLQGFEKSYPNQLSGGMRQRVGIARAYCNDPKVMLLDDARQAIKLGASEYILKTEITEENLRQVLEKGKRAVKAASGEGQEKHLEEALNRNHYLRSLVLSHKPEKANEALLRDFNIFPEKGEFIALVLKTREEGPLGTELPEEGPFEHMIKVPLELNYTALLGSFCQDASVSRLQRLQEAQSYCRLVLTHAPGWMGCSDLYDNPERIGDAMRQAYDRAKLSFYHPKASLFCTGNTGRYQLTDGEKYKIQFSRELVNQNFQNAVKIKEEMMEAARVQEITDIDYLKKLYFFFLTSLYHFTKDEVDKVEEELSALNQKIAEAISLEELDTVMEQGFLRCGSNGGAGRYSSPVRNAIRYMEDHFAQSLNLPEVAAHAGLSAEYLSRLFKEETGVKFVVYLNNLRLKHALHLLETTNLKVYEVAEKVGYSNLSYFSTVFKKNFGQNPFEYKNNYGN